MLNLKFFVSFIALLFIIACGRHADNPSELKRGYVFKRGKVMYQEVNRFGGSIDSFPRTIDSFVIVDTLPGFRKYIIADSWTTMPLILPSRDLSRVGFSGGEKYPVYGVADFNGDIVVYPGFSTWMPLPNGFYGIQIVCGQAQVWGLLHVNGVMMTDVKYENVSYDTASNRILCRMITGQDTTVDSIEPVYRPIE